MNLPRATLAIHLVLLALLTWVYGGELGDALRAPRAEVAAMTEAPSLAFAAAVLVFALAAAAVAGWGVARGRGREFKGYRVLPIVAVVVLFVDVFAISPEKVPISSADQLAFALEELRVALEARSTAAAVVTDEEVIRQELARLGKPPYLVRGERPSGYTLQLRQGCTEPVAEAPGAQVGTVIYCVSPNRKKAWLTAVALPVGERFGSPAVFRRGDELLFGAIDVEPPEGIPRELLQEVDKSDAGLPAPQ